jgi:hypothetical protein
VSGNEQDRKAEYIMGDSKGKKQKAKAQKQNDAKQAQVQKQKFAKQHPALP